MNVEIRKCTPDDIDAIIGLMRGFAEFENLGSYFEATGERLFSVMFGDKGFVEGIIAVEDDHTFAYALFYPNFASFRGQLGYYLEDIYISDEYRGKGIGEAMLRAIATLAKSRGLFSSWSGRVDSRRECAPGG